MGGRLVASIAAGLNGAATASSIRRHDHHPGGIASYAPWAVRQRRVFRRALAARRAVEN